MLICARGARAKCERMSVRYENYCPLLATVMEVMMAADAIEEDLARRFRIDSPPTLLARKSSKARIAFSRMRSSHSMRGRSLATPPQEAFAFHVPLAVPFFSNLWAAGEGREVPDWRVGYASLIDLS